jgi:hypothetical protein
MACRHRVARAEQDLAAVVQSDTTSITEYSTGLKRRILGVTNLVRRRENCRFIFRSSPAASSASGGPERQVDAGALALTIKYEICQHLYNIESLCCMQQMSVGHLHVALHARFRPSKPVIPCNKTIINKYSQSRESELVAAAAGR